MTNEEAVEKLKILKEDYWDGDGYGHESKLYDDTVVALDMAIQALEERKTGRWEWVQYESKPNFGNWHCSVCRRIISGAMTMKNPVFSYKYCPECGARMEGANIE